MINLSIIDIGSNTIHLLIVKIIDKNNYHILYEDKEHLRLGSELTINNRISNIKIEETIYLLKNYINISYTFKSSEIIVVATEALRIAENSLDIISLIKNNFGIEIKLLTSHDEAYLAFLSARKSYNITKGLIIDSGGGSTEFIGVKNNTFITSSSIPLGAINVTEKIYVDLNGKFLSCQYDKDYFFKFFSRSKWLKEFNNSTLIGIGGTFKNLKSIYEHLDTVTFSHNNITEISLNDLIFLCQSLKNMTLVQRQGLKGLSPKRSDIILGGCEILCNFLKYLEFDKIIITEAGIRTGILFHYMDIHFKHSLCENKSFIS